MAALGITPLGQFPLGWSILASPQAVAPPPASRTFTVGLMRGAKAVITPAELVDYAINWAPFLNPGEEILTSVWASTGISVNAKPCSIQASGVATTVWLSGGITGLTYIVTNTITTSQGREFQESFYCYVNAFNQM